VGLSGYEERFWLIANNPNGVIGHKFWALPIMYLILGQQAGTGN